jgi:hypothetical protein
MTGGSTCGDLDSGDLHGLEELTSHVKEGQERMNREREKKSEEGTRTPANVALWR